jgi:hypothetical protein
MTVINGRIGEIDILPAEYSGGTWTTKSWSCYCCWPEKAHISYRAGLITITQQARDAVIRLAHAKMPGYPCNAEPPTWMWQRDREKPRAMTKERLNCPFGLEDGAWAAYQFARAMKVGGGYQL